MRLKTYLRIPRVPRLEYLLEFLKSIREGYNREDARRRVQRIREEFEAEKARALGKKKPRPVRGASIVRECEKMGLQLRFAARSAGGWSLTTDGDELLKHCPEDLKDFPREEIKTTLISRLWQVYPRFGRTILAILHQQDGKMDLPMRSAAGSFRDTIRQEYQLDADVLTFNMIREIGTQLELLNWYVIEDDGRRRQRVYAIACVATLTSFEELDGQPARTESPLDACLQEIGLEIGALTIDEGVYRPHTLLNITPVSAAKTRGYLVIEAQGDYVFIKRHRKVDVGKLEEVLWKTYLEKVSYRPLFPILYPELRNEVCHRLRLPDRTFDRVVLGLIESPRRLRIYPSGGILDYASNLAHLHKYLPPKTSHGHFMTYLKIHRAK